MKCIAIIPARGGSKGIKNKNIISFCNEPLVSYTVRQAKKSKLIEDVYVSSDSDEILEISRHYGAEIIKRPQEISGDFAPSESALLHAIERLQEDVVIIFLQPTSPLRTTDDIDNAIRVFLDSDFDSLFSANVANDLCLWETTPILQSITYDYKNRKRRQDFKDFVIENGSFYITKSSFLKKNNNRLSGNIGYYIMENWKSHEIDSLEDLNLCEMIYKIKILKETNEKGIF